MLLKCYIQYANKFRKLSNGHRTGKGQFLFQSQRKAMPENVQTTTSECQRTDALELCCWRRLLRIPWTARTSNQSILKEIALKIHWKEWCWSWNPNTLAIWCEELTHLKRPWCWERLRAGREGDDRGWDGWMVSRTLWTWIWVTSGSWW